MDIRLGFVVDGSGVEAGIRLIKVALSGLDRAVYQLDRALSGIGRGFVNGLRFIKDQLFSLKSLIAGVGVGLLAKQFTDAGSESENLRIRLNALLGSVQEGNRLFSDMTQFASSVPFEYHDIMEAATQLSGIMKGGVAEIDQWMPRIADLAAVSGLSIQLTTEQIVRMLSGGAAAADLFRERGISAMLGFQQGVQYTAEETRKQLESVFTDPANRITGTTKQLADTWTGILSMMADKWFLFRQQVMEQGAVGSFIKALAKTLNDYLGRALNDLTINGDKWVSVMISGLNGVATAIGWVHDGFITLRGIWSLLKVAWYGTYEAIITSLQTLDETLTNFFNALHDKVEGILGVTKYLILPPGMKEALEIFSNLFTGEAKPREDLKKWALDAQVALFKARDELEGLLNPEPTGGQTFEQRLQNVKDEVMKFFREIEGTRRANAGLAAPGDARAQVDEWILVQQEQWRATVEMRTKNDKIIEDLDKNLYTAREQEMIDYWDRRTQIEDLFTSDERITKEKYNAWMEALEEQHQQNLTNITDRETKKRLRTTEMTLGYMANFMGAISDVIGQADKKRFEESKRWSRAQVLLSGAVAIMRAWELPWPANLAAGAAAVATTAAQLAAINRAQFSGGFSANVGGGGGGLSNNTQTQTNAPQAPNQNVGRELHVHFLGDFYGWDSYVQNKVIDGIKTVVNDYDEILIDESSANGRRLSASRS